MKKIYVLLTALCLTAVLLAGCGAQNNQVEEETTRENDAAVQGTWSEDYFDSGYVFHADGTGMDSFWQLPFTYTAYDGVITITYDDETYGVDKYSYTVDDSGITMTRQSDTSKSFTYKKVN